MNEQSNIPQQDFPRSKENVSDYRLFFICTRYESENRGNSFLTTDQEKYPERSGNERSAYGCPMRVAS